MLRKKILVVDDEQNILNYCRIDFEHEGYAVTTAENGEEAIMILCDNHFDLLITDLAMPGVDGIGVLRAAKKQYPEICAIILTGYGDMATAIEALRLGADDYLLKPCNTDEMLLRVARIFEKQEAFRKIKLYESILPVCCVCKSIRDDTGKEPGTGKWTQMENYIQDKGGVGVTSTYCPECAKKAKEELVRGPAE